MPTAPLLEQQCFKVCKKNIQGIIEWNPMRSSGRPVGLWGGGKPRWFLLVFFRGWWNYLGGGFKDVLFSPRKLGKMNPFWRAYFSDGLKPPTSWGCPYQMIYRDFVHQLRGEKKQGSSNYPCFFSLLAGGWSQAWCNSIWWGAEVLREWIFLFVKSPACDSSPIFGVWKIKLHAKMYLVKL